MPTSKGFSQSGTRNTFGWCSLGTAGVTAGVRDGSVFEPGWVLGSRSPARGSRAWGGAGPAGKRAGLASALPPTRREREGLGGAGAATAEGAEIEAGGGAGATGGASLTWRALVAGRLAPSVASVGGFRFEGTIAT